ncbi:unnamed protein product, partial [Candidula unifasciata]
DDLTVFVGDLEAKALQIVAEIVKAVGGVAIDKKRETQDDWVSIVADGTVAIQDAVKMFDDVKSLISVVGGK